MTNNGNSTYTVVYDLVVENLGDVNLDSVQVTDDLVTTFAAPATFTVDNVTSAGFTVNFPGYNGDGIPGLLAAGQSLAIGQVKTIQITVTVTPGANLGPYINQAAATGFSPANTQTTDVSDNGVNPDPTGDGDPAGQDENDPTPVDFSVIASADLTKSLNTPDPVRPGAPISFTIRITNTGSIWITTLPLQDSYDATFLTYGSGGNFATPASNDNVDDGVINWSDLTTSLGDLPPGGSVSVIVWFNAGDDTTALPNGDTLNIATVIGALPDPDGPLGPLPQWTSPLPTDEATAGVEILNPTGLGVYGLSARPLGLDVVIRWKTASEASIIGFNVLRSEQKWMAGPMIFEQVGAGMVEAAHAGSNSGQTYSVTDATADAGHSYRYVLEVYGRSGIVEELDPITYLARTSIFMPLMH